jgi:hypothetical protein
VKAQCGGGGFISETKSLNLVLRDSGKFTLKKGLLACLVLSFHGLM